jgi:hypothetical protein
VPDVIGQHTGLVMNQVTRSVDQRHASFRENVAELSDRIGISIEFKPISSLEFGPLRKIMAEPFAQRRARSNFLQP